MATTNGVRYFTFSDRFVKIRFFDQDPIEVQVEISDENDLKIGGVAKSLAKADSAEKLQDILSDMIGKENTRAIIERADRPDSYVLAQIILYVNRSYLDLRQKNLNTAASGIMI